MQTAIYPPKRILTSRNRDRGKASEFLSGDDFPVHVMDKDGRAAMQIHEAAGVPLAQRPWVDCMTGLSSL